MTRKIETKTGESGQGIFVDESAMKSLIESLIKNLIEAEIEKFIGAAKYERGPNRNAQRNGYKPRTIKSRIGELHFQVPQVRQGGFSPSVFEKYQRTEKALISTIQEMYVQGVSTRKVAKVMEELGGFSVSAGQVSKANMEIDEEIARFKKRRLDACEYPYLIIDARYEKIRKAGKVTSSAVLIAAGITDEGRREILGYYIGNSESEGTWSEVFKDLKERGIKGVQMITSDAHKGIISAMKKEFQDTAWQRCKVHLMRELLNKVSYKDYAELARDLRAIYVSEEKAQCEKAAEETARKWERKYPKLSAILLQGVEETLMSQDKPGALRKKLHSTNMLERLMKTIKARSKVVMIFPNESSAERLIGAMLVDKHEEWETEEKRYVNMDAWAPKE